MQSLEGLKQIRKLVRVVHSVLIGQFLLPIILLSCYTPNKASKQIDKAIEKHPAVAAKKFSEWMPIKIDSADLVKWKSEMDSIFSTYNFADTFVTNNITYNNCNEKIKNANQRIQLIREKIITLPPVVKYDSTQIIILNDAIKRIEEKNKKYNNRIYLLIGVASALLLLILVIIFFIIKRLK